MKSLTALAACLLTTTSVSAQFAYPPEFEDARVETYRTVGDTELRVWIFGDADAAATKPAIVFFFGGGWTAGSPTQFGNQARHFASRGMIAIAADYRVRSRHGAQMVDCVQDAKAATAWVRANATRLGITPSRIAASGGSAGGHLAASTATLRGFGHDETPDALILFNPACTLAPIADWQPSGAGTKLAAEQLGAPVEALSPAHHIGPHTPPTLILHGTADSTVPYESAVVFERLMREAGRPCKLVSYEGAEHGFFNRGEPYQKTLAEADAFLVELGWIAPRP